MSPILTQFLTSFLSGVTVFALCFLVIWLIKRKIAALTRELLTQPAPDKPSPLAVWYDNLCSILVARLVLQVKTTLMGLSSVEARNEKREAVDSLLAGNPALGAILSMIPGSRKLMRNPALLSMAAQALGKLSGAGGNHQAPTPAKLPNFD